MNFSVDKIKQTDGTYINALNSDDDIFYLINADEVVVFDITIIKSGGTSNYEKCYAISHSTFANTLVFKFKDEHKQIRNYLIIIEDRACTFALDTKLINDDTKQQLASARSIVELEAIISLVEL